MKLVKLTQEGGKPIWVNPDLVAHVAAHQPYHAGALPDVEPLSVIGYMGWGKESALIVVGSPEEVVKALLTGAPIARLLWQSRFTARGEVPKLPPELFGPSDRVYTLTVTEGV